MTHAQSANQAAHPLAAILVHSARIAPDRAYLHTGTDSRTYGELLEQARQLGAYLASLPGTTQTAAIALAIEPPELLALSIWAAVLQGLSVVFVPRVSERETMSRTLADAGVQLLLCDDAALSGDPRFLNVADAIRQAGSRFSRGTREHTFADSGAPEPAFLFQTSGTTGEPKWVRCEFGKCARAVAAMRDAGALDHARERTVFLTPPLYHSYGLSAFFEYTAVGGTVVFPAGVSPFGPAGDLQKPDVRERVQAIEGVPYFHSQLAKLANRIPLPSLRHIGIGGGALDPLVIERLLAVYPGATVSVRYGLTETPSVVTHKVFRPPHGKDWRSSGRVVPAYELSIVRADDLVAGPNEEGEIVVGGECVCGYRGEPTGALRTGDIGYLSEDGELFVMGRQSAYLKHRGFRISPEQVESFIGHFEGVRDCRVLTNESKLVAEVVCDEAARLADLPAYLGVRLPTHAVPDQIVRVAAIPRTASGKIRRH